MRINSLENYNNGNLTSFGKLSITKQAMENLLRCEPSKEKAMATIAQLKKELADNKHWDLLIFTYDWYKSLNYAAFINKNNSKERFYRQIRVAPASTLPKTVHIYSTNDGVIQEKGFLLGSLRFPTWRDALQADRSLQFLSRYASPHSVEGLKHLVSQTKILDTAYEYMGKKPPTLLQKIELFFRKKNEYSILLRAALNKSE